MPGHISTGFIMQPFGPESACTEQSSQEAAWPGGAGLSCTCACAHLPGLCPECTAVWESFMQAQEMLML